MPEERLSGKLAVILHADVADSTALVHRDERLAHQRIAGAFARAAETISAYGGIAHEVRGDALVAEFERASDAVCAALAFQSENAEHNLTVTDSIRPEIRVGVSLGEVVVAGGTLTGAGVVLAQRVEQLAEPNEVCITGAVREALPPRLPLEQVALGERALKGFAEPVRVYRVSVKAGEALPEAEAGRGRRPVLPATRTVAGVVAAALTLAGAAALWLQPWAPDFEPASVERMAFPLPEKPSIAVLPFANMSGDSAQEYFSDGLTENVITTLSQLPEVFVIARNSTFSYKGMAIKVQRVAEELGVRFVLEGSFLRAGERIRVHAQLVDALSGRHLWAERFDREWTDVFVLHDDLTQKIVSALELKLTEAQKARLAKRYTTSVEAYDHFLRGQALHMAFNPGDRQAARDQLQRAIRLDPGFARAYGVLAYTYYRANENSFFLPESEQAYERALDLARTAVDKDPTLPQAHAVLAEILIRLDPAQAAAAAGKALSLDPNYGDAYAIMALSRTFEGKAAEALDLIDKAMRLNPLPPSGYYMAQGRALFFLGRFAEAVTALDRALDINPNWQSAHVYLAAAYAELDRDDDAGWEREQITTEEPGFTIEGFTRIAGDLFRSRSYIDALVRGLRKAGLPERVSRPLPDKPSIAVLPFENMSGDPEQEYFSDGITEDIITDLSQLSNLAVIARNSSFTYKGTATKVQDIGLDLGVGYVLEGSVRRAGDRVRITAQLIDAATGHHLWAERYDRRLVDIFELQDEIRNKIVSALSIQLIGEESQRLSQRATGTFEAYDLFLKGQRLWAEESLESLEQAEALFRRAIDLDPGFARAYGALGITLSDQAKIDLTALDAESRLDRALEAAGKAVSIEPTSPQTHWALGYVHMWRQEFEQAADAVERAVALSPNYADGWGLLALISNQLGRGEQALRFIRRARALNPRYTWEYPYNEGRAHYVVGNYESAAGELRSALERNQSALYPRLYLAATYVRLGRIDDAQWEVTQLEVVNPGISLSRLDQHMASAGGEPRSRFFEDLRAAGLPE